MIQANSARATTRAHPLPWRKALLHTGRRVSARPSMPSAVSASMRSAPVAVDSAAFRREVLAGLDAPHKRIGGQWLHDERGRRLFDALTRAPQHYLSRTEQQLMARSAGEIAALAGPAATFVEAGASVSARTLWDLLERPARHLRIAAPAPALPADDRLGRRAAPGRCLVYLPSLVVGRCSADELTQLLALLRASAGAKALLVLGADATVDPDRLLPAYDDAEGANAAFNMNLLGRMNRELGAEFEIDSFRHAARLDTRQRRMEMHLVSRRDQQVQVAGQRFTFMQGESIVTEVAHKPSVARLRSLAWSAGWSPLQLWGDAHGGVAVHVFEGKDPSGAIA